MISRHQIPNLLTYARVLAVPVCFAIMLLAPAFEAALLWIFIAACLTDFLDGYLARKWNVVSTIGTLLDPIADKLLVALMLVYLLANAGLPAAWPLPPLFVAVIVILLRELYISGLREFLSARQIALPVSAGGKWKTALQMLGVTVLLWHGAYAVEPPPLFCTAPFAAAFSGLCHAGSAPMADFASLGLLLLHISAALALISAIGYTRSALKQLR